VTTVAFGWRRYTASCGVLTVPILMWSVAYARYVPVLVIFGENDIYGRTTERLVARYPNAKVVIIPRAGHVPWLQNRAAFVDAISTVFEVEEAALTRRGPRQVRGGLPDSGNV
jgi:pimeloyl-ACP methyl ester carboxylesterase